MDILTEFTDEHIEYWGHLNPRPVVFLEPPTLPDCAPARAMVTCSAQDPDAEVVRVGWKPNEIELAQLAQGGTLWLSTWGGLPPHSLEVQAPGRAGPG